MKIEAEQGIDDGPGWCRLRLSSIEGVATSAVELAIRRPGTNRPHLGPSGWQDAECWLSFAASSSDGALTLKIGPQHSQHLAKARIVEVRARIPGHREEEAQLAWPRMVLASLNDADLAPAAPAARPNTAPPAALPAAEASEELRAEAGGRVLLHRLPRRAPVAAVLAVAGALLVLGAAQSVWSLWSRFASPGEEAAPPAASRAYTEKEVRAFLEPGPDGASAVAEAVLYEEAGRPDLALLLYRHAARRGEAKAALAIGRMYDPQGFDPARSAFPAPDADQAAHYYADAAEAGDPEAQFRLGRLLLSGRTAEEASADRAILWLQRASDQGHAGARAALEALQAKASQ